MHSAIGHIPSKRRTEIMKALKLPSYDGNEKSYIEVHVWIVEAIQHGSPRNSSRGDHAFWVPFLEYAVDTKTRIKGNNVR